MLKASQSSQSKNEYKKLSLYSGHDKNIISVLQQFEIYDSHFPEFGSALIFELLKGERQYFVKVIIGSSL